MVVSTWTFLLFFNLLSLFSGDWASWYWGILWSNRCSAKWSQWIWLHSLLSVKGHREIAIVNVVMLHNYVCPFYHLHKLQKVLQFHYSCWLTYITPTREATGQTQLHDYVVWNLLRSLWSLVTNTYINRFPYKTCSLKVKLVSCEFFSICWWILVR